MPDVTGQVVVHTNDTKVGSATKPVYIAATGKATACSTYAGGTAVTLNGTSCAKTTASFYAPTSVGEAGHSLISSGSGAPTWGIPILSGAVYQGNSSSTISLTANTVTALPLSTPSNGNAIYTTANWTGGDDSNAGGIYIQDSGLYLVSFGIYFQSSASFTGNFKYDAFLYEGSTEVASANEVGYLSSASFVGAVNGARILNLTAGNYLYLKGRSVYQAAIMYPQNKATHVSLIYLGSVY